MDLLYGVLVLIGAALMAGASAIGRRVWARERTPGTLGGGGAQPVAGRGITGTDLVNAGAMLVGIVAKEIWDSINETSQAAISLPRFVGALIVSPIVYAAVYSQFGSADISLLSLAIAFQNGFFWQAVFHNVQGSQGIK